MQLRNKVPYLHTFGMLERKVFKCYIPDLLIHVDIYTFKIDMQV